MEYPGYIKKSFYVEVPAFYEGANRSDPMYAGDTVKLATDLLLPADENGFCAEGRFPAIVMASRDPFRFKEDDFAGNNKEALYIVRHGYALLVINMRGCGASFGVNNSFSSVENRLDIKFIMENWAPLQNWYSGSFAMMGGSNRGLIQGAVAAVQPKGLKGITPSDCNMEFYFGNFPNGVSSSLCSMNGLPGDIIAFLQGEDDPDNVLEYEEWVSKTKTVFTDSDPEGKEAYRAYHYRIDKNKVFGVYMILPNMARDTANPNMNGEQVYLTIPPAERTEEIRQSGIRTHQIAGYYDSNASALIAVANAWNDGTAVLGPWTHIEALMCKADPSRFPNNAFCLEQDLLRWFDHLLKGIDNGYEEAPRFYYYLVGADEGDEWRFSETFCPENAEYRDLYLTSRRILGEKVLNTEDTVSYRVDTSIQMPKDYVWHTVFTAEPLNECLDSKACVFTTVPFREDTDIVGIPTADIWISCENADDVDLILYLETVDTQGVSHYLSRAFMRASHRNIGHHPIWESTRGMAGRFHPGRTEDIEKARAEGLKTPVLLSFEFDTVSKRIKKGEHLRVSVTCADTKNCQHYMYYDLKDGKYLEKSSEELPLIKIHSGGEHGSKIAIPVLNDQYNVYAGELVSAGKSENATLYVFDQNIYLFCRGRWNRYPSSGLRESEDGVLRIADQKFICRKMLKNGIDCLE